MGEEAYRSMDAAIAEIKRKAYHCFYFFITQLCFFFVSAFLLMWILFSPVVAFSANAVLGLTLFFFVTNGVEIFDLLYISDEQAIDHKFGDDDGDDGLE